MKNDNVKESDNPMNNRRSSINTKPAKDQYTVVIIGFAHMHINDVAACFYENPRICLAACADTVPVVPELNEGPYTRGWNLRFAQEHFGIRKVYQDYAAMLDEEKPDLAIITSENAWHRQIVQDCAMRGVDVCIEKPMAMSYGDALTMARDAQATGTLLLVNWPVTWRPYLHQMKQLVDEGVIGQVIQIKYRAGHTGPLGPGARHRGVQQTADPMTDLEKSRTWWHQRNCGGGAMLDLCCYGSLLAAWFIGEPAQAVMGMKGNFASQWGEVEDNAAMLVRFPRAMAIVEGTWTTPQADAPVAPVIYGSKGMLSCVRQDETFVIRMTDLTGQTREWSVKPAAGHLTDTATAYVHTRDTGTPLHETLATELNLQAMAILDAGIRSTVSGQLEPVGSRVWQAE